MMLARALAAVVFGVLAAPSGALAQEPRAVPPQMPAAAPQARPDLPGAWLGDHARVRAMAAAAQGGSGRFADALAAQYLGGESGPDWRGAIGYIHDQGRVEALLRMRLAQIAPEAGEGAFPAAPSGARQLTPAREALLAALEAAELRMASGEGEARALAHYRSALGRGDARAAGAGALASAHDLAAGEIARAMNRDLAAARGFAEAGGYDVPITPEEQAADIELTAFERIAETEERIAARLYLALDAPLLREYEAFLNDPDEARLRALAALALEDVLIELAFESGRAAAQRARGEAL